MNDYGSGNFGQAWSGFPNFPKQEIEKKKIVKVKPKKIIKSCSNCKHENDETKLFLSLNDDSTRCDYCSYCDNLWEYKKTNNDNKDVIYSYQSFGAVEETMKNCLFLKNNNK